MMITKKAINDDIAFIVATLKNKEVAIPSFLSCAAPGIAVLVVSIHRNSIDTGKMRRSSLDPTFLLA